MVGITSAIVASAAIGAGGGLLASKSQSKAARKATDVQWDIYLQNREDATPWREAGAESVKKLSQLVQAGPGTFQKSPGYEFRLSEGLRALDRGAAAGGAFGSGAHLRRLEEYAQDYATADYDRWLQRYYQSLAPWQSLAGLGQTAQAQTAALGQQAAGNLSNIALQAGNARAGGYAGVANAFGQGLQNFALFSALNQGGGGLGGGGSFGGLSSYQIPTQAGLRSDFAAML